MPAPAKTNEIKIYDTKHEASARHSLSNNFPLKKVVLAYIVNKADITDAIVTPSRVLYQPAATITAVNHEA